MKRKSRPTSTFLERLAEHERKVREKAASLPEGEEREAMLLKVEQAKRAARISQLLSLSDNHANRKSREPNPV